MNKKARQFQYRELFFPELFNTISNENFSILISSLGSLLY